MLTSPRFDHRDSAVERIAELHEVHQNDVVHDGADGEIRHVGRNPEYLRVLIIEECRHQAEFAEGYQGVNEVPVHRLIFDGSTINRHAINHTLRYIKFFNGEYIVCAI